MYGNGIGVLRVKYRSSEGDSKVDKIMWEMSGESGNNWHQAQLPIASSTTYNIIFEGVIGPNYLGNIAIDSISIEHGVCPGKLINRFDNYYYCHYYCIINIASFAYYFYVLPVFNHIPIFHLFAFFFDKLLSNSLQLANFNYSFSSNCCS